MATAAARSFQAICRTASARSSPTALSPPFATGLRKVPCSLLRKHSTSSSTPKADPTEMAKVAEELAILLKATPSEANTVKAHGLYQQLSTYYIQEGVAPLTLSDIAMREIERRTNKLEIGYTVMSGLVFCMGSIIAGIHVQEKSLANGRDMKVARLEEKSTTADMSITRMDRKMLQLEYHLKATQCPCCRKSHVEETSSGSISSLPEAATDGASLVPEAAAGGASPGSEAGTSDSPQTWWNWFLRA